MMSSKTIVFTHILWKICSLLPIFHHQKVTLNFRNFKHEFSKQHELHLCVLSSKPLIRSSEITYDVALDMSELKIRILRSKIIYFNVFTMFNPRPVSLKMTNILFRVPEMSCNPFILLIIAILTLNIDFRGDAHFKLRKFTMSAGNYLNFLHRPQFFHRIEIFPQKSANTDLPENGHILKKNKGHSFKSHLKTHAKEHVSHV